ncbi:hypothetical protein ABPG74_018264 [Tetrahymena malaccensis]
MEKIKELVDVRFEIIKQYKKEIAQLQNENYNLTDNSNIQRKILKFIINAKKEEKQRISNENKLFEIFFSERSNSLSSIQQFYSISLQIMNCLFQNFELEQEMVFCKEPQYRNVASLYIEFFQQTKFLQRADEIKMIIKNELYERVPFFCLLLKWLVEMARTQFGDFIKENSDIYLKQLTSNRNKGSQKEIITITSNQDQDIIKQLPNKYNSSTFQISETLQTDNRKSRKSKRSSMSSLDSKQIDLINNCSYGGNTSNPTNRQYDKNQAALRSSMQSIQRMNSQTQLQVLSNGFSIQTSNQNLNCQSISLAAQGIHNSTKNSNQNQTQQGLSINTQNNNVDKKKQSPMKRQYNILSNINDIMDLEVNNFSIEMIMFLMKKLTQPDGSINDQGKQQMVNFMISKNLEVKATIENYYSKYLEKFPQKIKLQAQQMQSKILDKIQKRKRIQVVNCYNQSNNFMDQASSSQNQNGLSDFRRNSQTNKNEHNQCRPYSSQGIYSSSVNQSLNQSQIKMENKHALNNSFDIQINLQEGGILDQQVDQQNRPMSQQKNDFGNRIIIETKVKHLSLEQNLNSQNNQNNKQGNNQTRFQQNKLPYSGSLFSSENISQEKQVQNLTKLSQDQFVQRMRSTHKIYYLQKRNNQNNQTNSTNNSTTGSSNSYGLQEVSNNQPLQKVSVLKQNQQITPIKIVSIDGNEAAYSTIVLPTQGNESQKNLDPLQNNLDKIETIDYSSVMFTAQSSNRNKPQYPLVIPNPQYQYFYNSNQKQNSTLSTIEQGNRPKTASFTENSNRTYGIKTKINIQYLQNSKRQRSRSINQQLNQGKKQLLSNWVQPSNLATQQNQINQIPNGDTIKKIADISYQASLNNSTHFYGSKDMKGTVNIQNMSSQQNSQLGSNTLPIQANQNFQNNTLQQFRVSSAKKSQHSSLYADIQNNTNIKEKFYQISREKRRLSQTSYQQNSLINSQKLENNIQYFSVPQPNLQQNNQKQLYQNNNQNCIPNIGTRARHSLSVNDSLNQNQNCGKTIPQQNNFNSISHRPYASNIANQDISINLIQQSAIQFKKIQQDLANQPLLSRIKGNAKKK